MRPVMTCATAGIVLALSGLPSRAQSLPHIDIQASCKGVGGGLSGLAATDALTGCVHDETVAREQVNSRWSAYPAAARRECTAEVQIGGPASYVNLVTCLEMANNEAPTRPRAE